MNRKIITTILVAIVLTFCYYQRPASVQIQPQEQPAKTINYSRPSAAGVQPGQEATASIRTKKKKKVIPPDYTDVRVWYYDLESDSYKKRLHKY